MMSEKSKFGVWRIRTATRMTFRIPIRNEGVVPFEIPEGSLEFIINLDDETGEQQEKILSKMMADYWEYEGVQSSEQRSNGSETE